MAFGTTVVVVDNIAIEPVSITGFISASLGDGHVSFIEVFGRNDIFVGVDHCYIYLFCDDGRN